MKTEIENIESEKIGVNSNTAKESADKPVSESEILQLRKELVELRKSVDGLRKVTNRGVDWRYYIPISLVKGLATGLGATVVLAITVYLLSRIISQLEAVPFLESLLKSIPWDQIILNSN